jgi:hypothetical protein
MFIVDRRPDSFRTESPTELMQAWRRQLGQRARRAERIGPRQFTVVSYRISEPVFHGCVELRHLTLFALFDERCPSGDLATRLVGVAGSVTAYGLSFGGPSLSRFDKNLRLAPTIGGHGARLDTADRELMSFALQLERYLERCSRHPYVPRRRIPHLPVLVPGRLLMNDRCLIDLNSLPKRQVLPVESLARDLCGHCGTTVFDFYHTRFHVAR